MRKAILTHRHIFCQYHYSTARLLLNDVPVRYTEVTE